MKKRIILAVSACTTLGLTALAFASTSATDCTSIDRSALEAAFQKQQSGTTLSDEETILLANAKACFETRSGSGKLDQGGRGRFGSGKTMSGSEMPHRFGSGETFSGAHMPRFGSGETFSGMQMPPRSSSGEFDRRGPRSGSGEIMSGASDRQDHRAKLSDKYANTVDTFAKKYITSIESKTKDEQISSIDAFLEKIEKASAKIEASSSYSDATKVKYANVLEYLKELFEEEKASLDNSSDTDSNILSSILG